MHIYIYAMRFYRKSCLSTSKKRKKKKFKRNTEEREKETKKEKILWPN